MKVATEERCFIMAKRKPCKSWPHSSNHLCEDGKLSFAWTVLNKMWPTYDSLLFLPPHLQLISLTLTPNHHSPALHLPNHICFPHRHSFFCFTSTCDKPEPSGECHMSKISEHSNSLLMHWQGHEFIFHDLKMIFWKGTESICWFYKCVYGGTSLWTFKVHCLS